MEANIQVKGRIAGNLYPLYGGPSQLTYDEMVFLNDLIDEGRAPAIADVPAVAVTIRVQGRRRSSGAIEPGFIVVELKTLFDLEMKTVDGIEHISSSFKVHVGVAKRNCDDDAPDEARGRRIALARAARGEAVIVR